MCEVPFFRAQVDREEENLIKDALFNSEIKYGEIFEEEICKYFGAKYAIATTSGTTALHLALCAMDIKHGREPRSHDRTKSPQEAKMRLRLAHRGAFCGFRRHI